MIANQTSPTAFQFLCMALAIDTIDGQGLSNAVHRELLPKKSKVMLYLPFILVFNQLYITNKMEHFSFKSGRAMWVAKLIEEDWPIVLQ